MRKILPAAHTNCKTHENYRLNCDQYERLVIESEGACQICGYLAAHMPQRKLYIDHEAYRADYRPVVWRVRGLLCVTCNSKLGAGKSFNEAARSYLANSWYLRQCADLGIPLDGGPEPAEGSLVVDNFRVRLARTGDLWGRPGKRGDRGCSWAELNTHYGPFNLRQVDDPWDWPPPVLAPRFRFHIRLPEGTHMAMPEFATALGRLLTREEMTELAQLLVADKAD